MPDLTPLEKQMLQDSKEAQVDLPSVFTWKGTDYNCIANSQSNEIVIGPDGNPEEILLKLRTDRELFTDDIMPISGENVIFENVTYKVRRRRLIHNTFVWLDLISTNR